jgi:hypothetical protein
VVTKQFSPGLTAEFGYHVYSLTALTRLQGEFNNNLLASDARDLCQCWHR